MVSLSCPFSTSPEIVALNPLQNCVATIGTTGLLCIWDTATLECRSSVETDTTFLWASATLDRQELITCAGNRHICTWDATNLSILKELSPVQGSRVKHCAVSGNGKHAITVLFDSSISVWDLETRECVWQPQQRGDRDYRRVHSGGVNAVYIAEVRVVPFLLSW